MTKNTAGYAIDANEVDVGGVMRGWSARVKVPDKPWRPVCDARGNKEVFGSKQEAMANAGMVLVSILNNARGVQTVVARQPERRQAIRSVSVSGR